MKNCISIENVSPIYSLAIRYMAPKLEEFCFSFCLNHMSAVIKTEAFQTLDDAIIKGFLLKASDRGGFRS